MLRRRDGRCSGPKVPTASGGSVGRAPGDGPNAFSYDLTRTRCVTSVQKEDDAMGIMDKLKGLFGKHEAKVDEGIDKGAAAADEKFGDQVGSDKIDQAADHAHDAADKLAEG
jgi:hypothetical protein